MFPLPRIERLTGVATLALMVVPFAEAQAAPDQPPVYTPTSLTPEPGLPRTPDGHPSFEGVWTTNFFSMLEATPLTPNLVVTEDEGKAAVAQFVKMFSANPSIAIDPEAGDLLFHTDGFPIVRGERRSRTIISPADGKLPYTPAGQKAADAFDMATGAGSNNPEERPSGERCIVAGGQPPVAATLSLNPRQFIQTPGHIVIHTEMGDEARIIPLTNVHGPKALASRLGDFIARWEGDTLVVETIHLPAEDHVRGFPQMVVSAEAKVTERFTRLSNTELLYQFLVEDTASYTAPWLAEYSLYRTGQRMFPWSCHEANYSLPNILKAQRIADAKPKTPR